MALTVAANAITFSDQTSLSSGNIQGSQIVPGTITDDKIASGTINSDRFANNSITNSKLDSIGQGAGNPPIYACRAWVNFDGTITLPTIRDSRNVSSVTRNANGNYTVSFIAAMQNANYCICGSALGNIGNLVMSPISPITNTQCSLIASNTTSPGNNSHISFAIFQ